jgi:hypothetical protein
MVGIPFADLANFTILGCGSPCTAPPPPPPPTPTVTTECSATEYRIDNSSNGYDIYWGGQDCNGNSVGGTVGAYSIAYTGCVADGTFTYTGFPSISIAAIC